MKTILAVLLLGSAAGAKAEYLAQAVPIKELGAKALEMATPVGKVVAASRDGEGAVVITLDGDVAGINQQIVSLYEHGYSLARSGCPGRERMRLLASRDPIAYERLELVAGDRLVARVKELRAEGNIVSVHCDRISVKYGQVTQMASRVVVTYRPKLLSIQDLVFGR